MAYKRLQLSAIFMRINPIFQIIALHYTLGEIISKNEIPFFYPMDPMQQTH
jgi:hypothetical protein